MRYLLIISLLVSACHSAHKSESELKQKVNKTFMNEKDSAASTSIDSSTMTGVLSWIISTTDSGYDKVTEEVVKEIIDSNIIHRSITRTIKEKGQKRIEQSSTIIKNDSTGKKINQDAAVRQTQKQDSSVTTIINEKEIKRTSFLPWWIWLIPLAVAGITWWKRNSIIDFFTKK